MVVSSYLLADTVATVLAGKFGDLFGRKAVFQVSAGTFVLASAACGFAGNMTYAGKHPQVQRVSQTYSKGVRRSKAEMKILEGRLVRLEGLPKWFITIAPPKSDEIILPARVTHCPLLCLP